MLFSTCTTDERVVWLRLAHDYELKQFASGLRSGSLFIKAPKAPPEWNLRYGRSPLKRDVLLIYTQKWLAFDWLQCAGRDLSLYRRGNRDVPGQFTCDSH